MANDYNDRNYDRNRYRSDWNRDYEQGRDYDRDWRGNYNRGYGYSYTGDYTRDYDRDYNRDYDRGWRGNYNRDYGYSYTGDYTRDYDRNYDRGYDRSYRANYGSGYDGSDYDRGQSRGYRNWDRGQMTSYNQNQNRDRGQNQDWDNDQDVFDNEPTTWTYTEWWLIPGPFTGVGPRGYQRSDDRICEDICDRLAQHGQIDASDVDVDVNNGEVTLKGNVDNRRMKRMAEDVAETVSGVRDVHNQLHVNKQGKEHKQHHGQQQQHGMQSGQQGRQMGGGMGMLHDQIHEGMPVVGSNGDSIGTVKEIRGNDFLVDRPVARDVYVPFSACQTMTGNRVMLNVRSDHVDNQGWPQPQIVGQDQGNSSR